MMWIRHALTGIAAVSLIGVLTGCPPPEERPADPGDRWEEQPRDPAPPPPPPEPEPEPEPDPWEPDPQPEPDPWEPDP